MSLMLNLFRQLLEYFGFPLEQFTPIWEAHANGRSIVRVIVTSLPSNLFSRTDLYQICSTILPSWENKEYGSTRSIVRSIGKILPLEPCPRPNFELFQYMKSLDCDQHGSALNPIVPSFADILCVANDEARQDRFRNCIWEKYEDKTQFFNPMPPPLIPLSPVSSQRMQIINGLPVTKAAIKKIAALQDELTILRSQIAAIVALQEAENKFTLESLKSYDIPGNLGPLPSVTSSPSPVPDCSSNSVVHPLPPPPPPPPPPLPPLPPPPPSSPGSNICDSDSSTDRLIKEVHIANKNNTEKYAENQRTKVVPSMMDVLKDMDKVKLRAIERSPGGRPIHKTRREISDWDPVSIISHALKKKFAFQEEDSFEKEDTSWDSSFFSPETPKFEHRILQPNGQCMEEEIDKVSQRKEDERKEEGKEKDEKKGAKQRPELMRKKCGGK
ncbi:mitochondrial fission regulator 2 isoform X2 [Monodelphis domestica]|uniref:Mitochondrial fission regulator n=1 Tax=Monodelphis domestica TaxID=13616 RepID=F6Z5S7_MONDO|nr:mitochondrial fission regulator 2 isoform X2 [Monodelphis domestica]